MRIRVDGSIAGYSSLIYLSRLPVNIVKIDHGFIAELDQPSARIVVAAVTRMAHELGLEVVGEGVETQTQRDATVAMGCDYTQGYFLARPTTAAGIKSFC